MHLCTCMHIYTDEKQKKKGYPHTLNYFIVRKNAYSNDIVYTCSENKFTNSFGFCISYSCYNIFSVNLIKVLCQTCPLVHHTLLL